MSRRFTRGEKLTGGAVVAFWILAVLLNIAFWGVVVWGIISLVNWVTAQ